MQTTAIRTVANSLPENEVIFLTLLISNRYILFAELLINFLIYDKRVFKNTSIVIHNIKDGILLLTVISDYTVLLTYLSIFPFG